MSTIIESIERRQLRQVPRFEPGDRVRVYFQVVEGERRRTQVFEGIVIKRQGSGARETFTVRKQSFGVGVERTFPVHSPKIERLEVAGRGDVRRAKLYYLRDRVGKRARVAERRWGIEDAPVIGDAGEGDGLDSEEVAQAELDPASDVEGDEGHVAEGNEGRAAEGTEAEGTLESSEADATPQEDAAEEGPVSDEDDAPSAADQDSAPDLVSIVKESEGAETEPDDATSETESEGDPDAEAGGGAGADDVRDR